jgi:glucose-1-phosphate cytidylyltransferase
MLVSIPVSTNEIRHSEMSDWRSSTAVPPQASFHVVGVDEQSRVNEITQVATMPMWVNGGFFVLRRQVFDVLGQDEDLVEDAFARLAARGKLKAVRHNGFWAPMDTLKERSQLEALERSGRAPWKLWARHPEPAERPVVPRPTRSAGLAG